MKIPNWYRALLKNAKFAGMAFVQMARPVQTAKEIAAYAQPHAEMETQTQVKNAMMETYSITMAVHPIVKTSFVETMLFRQVKIAIRATDVQTEMLVMKRISAVTVHRALTVA